MLNKGTTLISHQRDFFIILFHSNGGGGFKLYNKAKSVHLFIIYYLMP